MCIRDRVLALAMAVSLFTGCGKKNNAETGESDPKIGRAPV